MHRSPGAELLLLGASELWRLCLPGLGDVGERSDVSLISVDSLFLYFDAVLTWMDFMCRDLFILLRILWRIHSYMLG